VIVNFKDLFAVGEFKKVHIMPSGFYHFDLSEFVGGVTPENVQTWLEAGATAVGMGSKLVGNDIRCPKGDSNFEKLHEEWNQKGRSSVKEFFTQFYQ
jgi:2-keto-3-deoxy-6-phosphogluconate aldolase